MTALNTFARDDGAWMLADTGSYADNGRVLRFQPKVAASERLAMVIGHTGRLEIGCNSDIAEWLAAQLDQVTALSRLPALLRMLAAYDREAMDNGAADACGPLPEGIRLVIAMWCQESDRAKVAIIATTEALSGGTPPFTLRPCRTLFMPTLAADRWPGHSFDPATDAGDLSDLQRRTPDDRGICRVGGEFGRWRVHAAGIERDVVRTWPDRVGQPISLAAPVRRRLGLFGRRQAA